MEKVKRYDTVKVHYKLSVDGRGIIESTYESTPLQFTMNAGHVVPGLERAVKGMLPKNRLGRKMYKKLFVYVGAAHPHTAQQPKELKF